MDRIALILTLLAAPLLGCSQDSTVSASNDSPAASQDGGEGGPAAEPAFEPITSRTAEGSVVAAPGAVFNLPPGWIEETPSSSMRLAQARIPGPEGDGQLTVFFFGVGGGGGAESNIERWIGQVETAAEPQREVFVDGSFQVTWVEARGTLKPNTMGGPTEPQPGSVLLGAVVEGPGGPWYFKATGPAGTLDPQRDAFLAMLRSLRSAA